MTHKSLGEALAALGVIASMAFVGLEIRQNNTLAEAAAYQELGLATRANWIGAAHNPELNTLLWASKRADTDSTWWIALDQGQRDHFVEYLESAWAAAR